MNEYKDAKYCVNVLNGGKDKICINQKINW